MTELDSRRTSFLLMLPALVPLLLSAPALGQGIPGPSPVPTSAAKALTPPAAQPAGTAGPPAKTAAVAPPKGTKHDGKKALAAPVPAPPPVVHVTLANLVEKKVDVEPPAAGSELDVAPAKTCASGSAVNGAKLSLKLDHLNTEECGGLVGTNPKGALVAAELADGKFAVFDVKVAVTNTEDAVPFVLQTAGKAIGNLPAANGASRTLYWSDGASWFAVTPDADGTFALPTAIQDALKTGQGQYQVYADFDQAGHRLANGASAALVKMSGTTPKPAPKPPRDWCARSATGYTVCLDFYSNVLERSKRRVTVYPEDTNHILLPNQSVRVVVLRRKDDDVSIDLAGDEGVYSSTDRNLVTPPTDELHADRSKQESAEPDFDIDDQEFAPRLPGKADLTVTLTRDGKDEVRKVEFVVEPTYVGAVRLGASVVFGNATDRSYEARSVSGSKQAEVVATKKQNADLELVLGYSAYLKPRGYAEPSFTNFEPYVGIGVLNQGPTGLETLKSLHAGIEWEPSPNFGIAFTGVVRRVTRLSDGVRIGSPITGDVPTVEKAEFGFGLVFNLSPEFLRVAKQAGSTFFK